MKPADSGIAFSLGEDHLEFQFASIWQLLRQTGKGKFQQCEIHQIPNLGKIALAHLGSFAHLKKASGVVGEPQMVVSVSWKSGKWR